MSPASRWEKYKVAGPTATAPANRWDQYRVEPAPTGPVLAAPTSMLPRWAEPAINALPAVTSGVAGLAGGGEGPLAIGLAGAGGSAGEVARELLAQHFGLSTDQGVNWKNVAAQGGIGAGSQLAGGLITKGAGAGARALMKTSLGPTVRQLGRFPSMIDEALQAGVIPGKNAVKSIAGKLGESSARLNDLLTRAEGAGANFDLGEITEPARREIAKLAKSRVPAIQRQARVMFDELQDFMSRNPVGQKLSPLDVQRIKQEAQSLADPLFAKRAAGTSSALSPIQQKFHDLLAQGSQRALESIDTKFGHILKPGELGVAARNLKTQGLIGVQRALAAGRSGGNALTNMLVRHVGLPAAGAAAGGLVPGDRRAHAALGAALAESANVPALGALYAHSLNNPLIQQLLAQGPRALAALAQP